MQDVGVEGLELMVKRLGGPKAQLTGQLQVSKWGTCDGQHCATLAALGSYRCSILRQLLEVNLGKIGSLGSYRCSIFLGVL